MSYQAAYNSVGEELGVHIIHENRVIPGINFRQILGLTSWLPRGRGILNRQMYRLTTAVPLPQKVLELTDDVDFVTLAVDDMVYFRDTSFTQATLALIDNPEICLWSWRIGANRNPHPDVVIHNQEWLAPYHHMPIPYGYIFHTDGSLYRRADLQQWLGAVPQGKMLTLNNVEAYLWRLYQKQPNQFNFGALHAGPLDQTCVTWQINRVSASATAGFYATSYSDPNYLLKRYLEGARLDYSELYGSDEWLAQLNLHGDRSWTHVAPTQQAVEKWYSLVKCPSCR